MSERIAVPEDFEPVPTGLGFSDQLQPYYRRINEAGVSFGFIVGDEHVNLMHICHGGALMTLADIAAAIAVGHAIGEPRLIPTINLSFDFQSAARHGRWIQTRSDAVELKRRFGFCQGVVLDGQRTLMRYSGVFYIDSDQGVVPEAAERARQLFGSGG